MDQLYDIVEFLKTKIIRNPIIGIVCGSGLSGLSQSLKETITINYEDIPGFPHATVSGHLGELVFGKMIDEQTNISIDCVCLRGRFHYYEGKSMIDVVLPIRVMRMLGVKLVILTNAAGGLNPNYEVGDIAIIHDHFAQVIASGNNPLIGSNLDVLGPRFPSISDCYNPSIQKLVQKVSTELQLDNIIRTNATYCFVSGPCYESIVESRFLRSIGGDCVGMSTIPEVIAAKHCGMQVLVLSLITNKAIVSYERDESNIAASHKEVLENVNKSGKNMEMLVRTFLTSSQLQEVLNHLNVELIEIPTRRFKLSFSFLKGFSLFLLSSALFTIMTSHKKLK